ncbi:MAG: aminotransferase class I/II-fold pyridoxal phosphate-dependent enzyme [Candidatus Omnitrophica bacterium]|nr:aminotransferase class I/II-fold pyridoxal phosphate-dependent enzyme [Candidatus Omnitrophota bacterium]
MKNSNKIIQISKKVEDMAPSGIRAFFDLVLGMKDVISLGVGEPDFVTPWNIREKAITAYEEGYTSYTSNKGLISLRKQISHFLKYKFGMEYDPENEILITVGVSEALDLAWRTLINPGDKVLIPEPCYVSYAPLADMAGAKVISLITKAEHGFKMTPSELDQACQKDKIKYLMINYPSNPTGASYNKAELSALCKVIKKHDLVVISDEVYDDLTYDFEHVALSSLPGMKERVVYLNGFSKAYAMTGFRIGFACGPEKVIAGMTKIHQYTILCASINGQMAAEEALANGHKSVNMMKIEYKRRRQFIIESLNEIGLKCHMPEGAFYAFPSIKTTGMSSMDFAKDLLKEQKVALVPGVAFGPSAEGHVRISYATAFEDLKEAVVRIKKFIKS